MGAGKHHGKIMQTGIVSDDQDAGDLERNIDQLIQNLAWTCEVEFC